MVTLSDARMSGTAYGCHVLHISPEAAAGGPLGIVQSGDWVVLDVAGRQVNVELDEETFKGRMAALAAKPAAIHSPWGAIWHDERLGVHQADVGAYMKMFDLPELSGREIARRVRERLRPQH